MIGWGFPCFVLSHSSARRKSIITSFTLLPFHTIGWLQYPVWHWWSTKECNFKKQVEHTKKNSYPLNWGWWINFVSWENNKSKKYFSFLGFIKSTRTLDRVLRVWGERYLNKNPVFDVFGVTTSQCLHRWKKGKTESSSPQKWLEYSVLSSCLGGFHKRTMIFKDFFLSTPWRLKKRLNYTVYVCTVKKQTYKIM